MNYFPDLSAGSRRRSWLSLGLLAALLVGLFLNEKRKTEARARQTAMMQQGMSGSLSVEQENRVFWGLVDLFGKTMDANMEQMSQEIDADQAEFNRRFEIEKRERNNQIDRGERDH